MDQPWVIVDVDGGLVQDVIVEPGQNVYVVVIDFDNLTRKVIEDPDEAVSYYREKLEELRMLPPGRVRKSWRLAMAERMDWAR